MVTKGYTDSNTAQMIAGAFVALASIIWGVMHRNQDGQAQTIQIKQSALSYVLICALSIGTFSTALTGCTSTPSRIAYNTVETPAASVDVAMTAWGDYVRQYHPTAATEAKVRDAFQKYQAAELLAIDAAKTYADQAASGSTNSFSAQVQSALTSQSAQSTLADLVKLIQSLGAKL